MKIKPNTRYETRDGRVIFISSVDNGGPWPVHGHFPDGRLTTFTRSGRYTNRLKRTGLDLVREFKDYGWRPPTSFRAYALIGLAVLAGTMAILIGGYHMALFFSSL
ncbi:hypothetical protein B2_9 [Stenotrophomonas phage B2]|nr:hypothetical protein B2_9 [Stenotrophomonas phage B2]